MSSAEAELMDAQWADMKAGVHFESLFEGGPQFILQFWLLVKDWEDISILLSNLQLSGWIRIFSPCFSMGGLLAQ